MSLHSYQRSMGQHLRAPRSATLATDSACLPPARLKLYSDLLHNKLDSLLRPCFPVCVSVLGARWPRLVRAFLQAAACQTPLFREVPGEFVQWLLRTPDLPLHLPPWLRALAHYEWAELAVDVMPADVRITPLTPAELASQPVVLNPTALNLHYPWPVHRIGTHWRPRKPQDTWLLVYRDRQDAVQFMALSATASRLLQLLATHAQRGLALSGRAACEALATELDAPQRDTIIDTGLQQLLAWHHADILTGAHHA
jgi:hypothetical protein